MNPSPTVTELAGRPDPRLAAAVDLARAAAEADSAEVNPVGAVGELVGEHVAVLAEDTAAATHLFEANYPGYRGWRWAVTVSTVGDDQPVTVSEVVLLPGPDALVAPEWVPWDQRVRAGDLGVGDLLPSAPDDPRLVPAYLQSDDPAVDEVVRELGLGRRRVLSRDGRLDAAQRWHDERGPSSDMAMSAPGACGTCGFYLRIAGSLSAAFGVCGNEFAPADGRVVHVEFGCGAHSEVEVEPVPLAPVAEVVYDDAQLDLVVVNPPASATASAADASETAVAASSVDGSETPAEPLGESSSDGPETPADTSVQVPTEAPVGAADVPAEAAVDTPVEPSAADLRAPAESPAAVEPSAELPTQQSAGDVDGGDAGGEMPEPAGARPTGE